MLVEVQRLLACSVCAETSWTKPVVAGTIQNLDYGLGWTLDLKIDWSMDLKVD